MLEKFCENLLAEIRDSQREYENRILSGSFKKLSDYKFIAGFNKGIGSVEEMVKRVYKNMVETRHLVPERKRIEGYREYGDRQE